MDSPFRLNPQHVLVSSALEQIPWLEHGFGTRHSTGWPDGPVTSLHQIHSDRIVICRGDVGKIGEGDALVTAVPGCRLTIRTADCLPILAADKTKPIVAAIHAGWRGSVAGIAPKTIRLLVSEMGSRLSDLVIAIGPGIGGCCFEVGPEVALQFQALFPERGDLGERAKVDLGEANRRQLCQIGILPEQIVTHSECTYCNQAYESFRRDREQSGRMVAMIGIRADRSS